MFGLFGKRRPVVAVVKKKGRPTRSEAAERRRQKVMDQRNEMALALEQAKLERELRRLGGQEEQQITINDLARIQRLIQPLGLAITTRASVGEGGSFLERMLTSPMAERMIGGLVAGAAQQAPAEPEQTPSYSAPPAPIPTAARAPAPPAAAPAPTAEPAAPVPVPVPVAERRRSDPIPGPAALPSVMAHVILEGRTPREAAAQLASVTQFDVPAVVAYLCKTPDDELLGYLARIGTTQPQFAGLMRWCAADPEWTIAVVRELRALGGGAAADGEPA